MQCRTTNVGYNAIMTALGGGEGIKFVGVSVGNGEEPEDYFKLTSLQNELKYIGISAIELSVADDSSANSFAKLTVNFSNNDIENGFDWTEIGIWIKSGEEKKLFAYGRYDYCADVNAEPSYIPGINERAVEFTFITTVAVGEATDVAAVLVASAQYATKEELKTHLEDEENPHKVTKSQVGLDQVENVTSEEQKLTFEEAKTLTNIISGEKRYIILGKIGKSITELISHLLDRTIHVTDKERSTWNGKAAGSHNHAASNITSGILGVSRGGTGGGTAADAIAKLGLSSSVSNGKVYTSNGITQYVLKFDSGIMLIGIVTKITNYPEACTSEGFEYQTAFKTRPTVIASIDTADPDKTNITVKTDSEDSSVYLINVCINSTRKQEHTNYVYILAIGRWK